MTELKSKICSPMPTPIRLVAYERRTHFTVKSELILYIESIDFSIKRTFCCVVKTQ